MMLTATPYHPPDFRFIVRAVVHRDQLKVAEFAVALKCAGRLAKNAISLGSDQHHNVAGVKFENVAKFGLWKFDRAFRANLNHQFIRHIATKLESANSKRGSF